jgi:hypothetical protein
MANFIEPVIARASESLRQFRVPCWRPQTRVATTAVSLHSQLLRRQSHSIGDNSGDVGSTM